MDNKFPILFLRYFLWCLVFLNTPKIIFSQEICNNGIDDDSNGLTDYLEEICTCGEFKEILLEADFEMYSCCPSDITQIFNSNDGIFCLNNGWIPLGSDTTPDFFHSCGHLGFQDGPNVPLPFPSGDGAIGFGTLNGFNEAVGKCMDQFIYAEKNYTIEFYLGFNSSYVSPSPSPFEISIYGKSGCSNFLVLGNDCLSNEGWLEMATTSVTGIDSSWTFVSIDFSPPYALNAISISGACSEFFDNDNKYHFLDNVILYEKVPGDTLTVNTIQENGNCLEGKILSIDQEEVLDYQWYFNDLPIAGANNPTYQLEPPYINGDFSVYINTPIGCGVSQPLEVILDVEVLDLNGSITHNLCADEASGIIEIEAPSLNPPFDLIWDNGIGSDTINNITSQSHSIESLTNGTYQVTVIDNNGCYGTEIYEVSSPDPIDNNLTITNPLTPDEFGTVSIITSGGIEPYDYLWDNGNTEPTDEFLNPGMYCITVTDNNECKAKLSLEIKSNSSFEEIYISNIFSPNQDGINDYFFPKNNENINVQLSNMTIYDRWGNLVFQKYNIPLKDESSGWNGQLKDDTVIQGIYIYTLQIVLPSGENKSFKGTVTLVK